MRRHLYSAVEDFCTTSRRRQGDAETHRNKRIVIRHMQRLVELDTKGVNEEALHDEEACKETLVCALTAFALRIAIKSLTVGESNVPETY